MSQPSNRIPQHSTGWKVGRLLTDRGGKNTIESPHQWGRHRELNTDDRIRRAAYQIAAVNKVQALTRR